MQTVGLSVILGADFSSAEEAMAKFRQSVNSLASETSKAFASMAGTASNIGNAFKPVSDGARNATQVVINESKARVQVNNEETQAALNASRLKIQALREESAEQRAATQAKKAEKDEYAQLVAKSQALVREYYNASASLIRYGEASGITKEKLESMAAAALAGQEQLKSIEAGAGRFQRNVGNYSSATAYLQQSIAQLSGEIPNFFQSMRIGFMSIGNNIQPLTQAIKGLRAENAQLVAQGKATKSVLGTVAKSFLGWQTVLLVGVGLISRYGAELVDWVTGANAAKDVAERLKKQQEELVQIDQQATRSFAESTGKLKVYISIATDANLKMKDRVDAIKKAKKEYPGLLDAYSQENLLQSKFAEKILPDLINKLHAAALMKAALAKGDSFADRELTSAKKASDAYKDLRKAQQELNDFKAGIKDIDEYRREARRSQISEAASGITPQVSELDKLESKVYRAGKAYLEYSGDVLQAKNASNEWYNLAKEQIVASGTLADQVHKTGSQTSGLGKSTDALKGKFREIAGQLDNGMITALEATKQKLSAVGSYINDMFKSGTKVGLQEYIELWKQLNYQVSQMRPIDLNAAKGLTESAGDRFHNDYHELTKGNQDRAAKFGDDAYSQVGDPQKAIKRRTKETAEEARRLNAEFSKTYSQLNRIAGGPLDSFVGALFNGENAIDALGNSIKDIVKNLAAAVIKAGIFSAIMSAINPTGFAAGGGFLGVLGKLLPFASGGIVTGPTPALVGEAGPEAIIPLNKLGSIMNRDLNVRVSGKLRGMDINVANEKAQAFKTR